MSSVNNTEEKILSVLEQIRPSLVGHGGDLEFVEFKKEKLKLKIMGACLGCPHAQMTFSEQMEEFIKAEVPEVKKIEFI